MFGSLTGRGSAQVLRLSCVYALLDQSREIQTCHLQAGVSLWRRVEESVRSIFGERSGDPIADRIYQALKNQSSMSETEISGLFGRHQPASRIEIALGYLRENGCIALTRERTLGRGIRRWELADGAK